MTRPTDMPAQDFETWMQDAAPLVFACGKLYNMIKDNRAWCRIPGDWPIWTDAEFDAQRTLIESLRHG